MSAHEYARRLELECDAGDRCAVRNVGAFRVMDERGICIARYIVDTHGLAYAHVYRWAPKPPRSSSRSPIGHVLSLVERGRLELVRVA